MKTRIARITYDKKQSADIDATQHRELIDRQAEEGYVFAGCIPVRVGRGGRILAADLIFQKP